MLLYYDKQIEHQVSDWLMMTMNPSVHFGKHVLHLFLTHNARQETQILDIFWPITCFNPQFHTVIKSLKIHTEPSRDCEKKTLSQNWVGVFSWTGPPRRGSQRPEFGSPTNPTLTLWECVVVWCITLAWHFMCITSVRIFNDPHFGARGVVHPPCAVAILLSVSTHELFIREIIQIYQIYSNILPVSSYLGNGPISSPHIRELRSLPCCLSARFDILDKWTFHKGAS